MRLMGLDIGDATIGIAVSDLLGLTAQGITTVRRHGIEKDLIAMAELVKEYEVEAFVAGMPFNMNGSRGPSVDKIEALCEIFKEEFGLPVFFQDERLSTVSAHRMLIQGDVNRKKRKQVVDKVAAVFILQTYLDNPKNIK